MRRRLLTVAIFLLAGAVVNVAVAWGCARFVRVSSSPDPVTLTTSEFEAIVEAVVALYMEIGQRPPTPFAVSYRGSGIEGARAQRFVGFGITIDLTFVDHGWSSDIEATWSPLGIDDVQWPGVRRRSPAEVLRVGWPVRCLRKDPHDRLLSWPPGVVLDPDLVFELAMLRRLGANLPTPPPRPLRPIFFRPIWPGFAVNTAFYAAILWLLIPGPFALRRLIRRRRGVCRACGYDLRHAEHEACPECGVTA